MNTTSPHPWTAELALAYESGAAGQFVLVGNVRDRLPLPDGELGDLDDLLMRGLLGTFKVVLSFDLGNGLRVLRGQEILAQFSGWPAALPLRLREAAMLVSQWLRFVASLAALGRDSAPPAAIIIRDAHLAVPASAANHPEIAAAASLLRDWAGEAPFTRLPFASFLVADTLAELHPLVKDNPRCQTITVPLPDAAALGAVLHRLAADYPRAFTSGADPETLGAPFVGCTAASLESLVRRRAHQGKPLSLRDAQGQRAALVEGEAGNLLRLIEPKRNLDDYHGQEAVVSHLRTDAALWQQGERDALPMGYLLCGPVGTGKTYLAECLAGTFGIPLVRMGNIREKWIGSSEGNLERVLRLVDALGGCIVFIDEADQALGRRDAGAGAGAGDGGLGGRLYAMWAEAMSDTRRRGRVLWLLASSRPDLIEVDLKRPGRIDVKIPLFPTTTPAEGASLLRALLAKRGLLLHSDDLNGLPIPHLLTPGAAEALAVKAWRLHKAQKLGAKAAVAACLADYLAPVNPATIEAQIRLAIAEATDLAFVPTALRHLGESR